MNKTFYYDSSKENYFVIDWKFDESKYNKDEGVYVNKIVLYLLNYNLGI